MIKSFIEVGDTFSSNIYVIGKINSPCIIIDPGSDDSSLTSYISSYHSKVEAILITHGHFDHIQGIEKILQYFNYDIPIYISKEDNELLTDSFLNCSSNHNMNVSIHISPILIESEDIIKTKSFSFKPILTPYHTKGSICYLFEDDNALFTGDSLFKNSIGREDLPTAVPSMRNSSLSKVVHLSKYLSIYPGHGEITSLESEIKNNPYLRNLK